MSTLVETLKQIMKDELRCSDELLEILYKEREALTGKDPDVVRQIAADKQEAAAQLETYSRMRNEHLLNHGFDDEHDALDKVIVAYPEAASLTTVRNKLQVILEQCKKQNQINGSILDGSQRGIRQALNILRGQTAPTEVYTKSGTTSHQAQTSTLTKA